MMEHLLARGDQVAATVRQTQALTDLTAKYSDHLWVGVLDVSDAAACHRVVDATFAALSPIDVVMNSADYGLYGAAEEVSSTQIQEQIATNLIGSMEIIRAALPHLRAQDGGSIVQIASEGGRVAYPNFSVYHATKWGIEGFITAVAQEVAPSEIAFTIAEPGPAATGFGAAKVVAPALAVYQDTLAREARRNNEAGTAFVRSDAAQMVDAIIASTERDPAPRRLVLGATSYTNIRATLLQQLEELDAQQALAVQIDAAPTTL